MAPALPWPDALFSQALAISACVFFGCWKVLASWFTWDAEPGRWCFWNSWDTVWKGALAMLDTGAGSFHALAGTVFFESGDLAFFAPDTVS